MPHKAQGRELNLFEILTGIKRRFDLVAGFAALFLLLGILIVWTHPRKYEAMTLVALETSEQNFGTAAQQNTGNATMLLPPAESLVLSQVEMLHSSALAAAVVQDMGLGREGPFWSGMSRPENAPDAERKAIRSVTSQITVKPAGRSLVMEIRYRHDDPNMAARIVSRYAELAQEQQVIDKISAARKKSLWLQQRLEKVNLKMQESARIAETYRQAHGLSAESRDTEKQVSDLTAQLTKARIEQADILARKERADHLLKTGHSLDHLAEIKHARLIELLKRDEDTLSAELAQLHSKYGPNHPKILALSAQRGELQRRKQAEINRLAGDIDDEAATIANRIDLLQRQLDKAQQQTGNENRLMIEWRALQGEADTNRELYRNFLTYYKQASMLGDSQQPDIRIISPAKIPVEPSGLNPILLVMMTSFAGAMLGMLVVLILEQASAVIRHQDQLWVLAGIETLAVVPAANPTEQLRSLSVRLTGRLEKLPAILAINPCGPQPDQSALVAGLARVMTQSGLRVLSIDPATLGLTDTSEQALRERLRELQENHDILLIDIQSAQSAEGQLFNRLADQCVVTVQWDKTPAHAVKDIIRQMNFDRNHVGGFILFGEPE